MATLELFTLTGIIIISPVLVELVLSRFIRRQDRIEKRQLERFEKSLSDSLD